MLRPHLARSLDYPGLFVRSDSRTFDLPDPIELPRKRDHRRRRIGNPVQRNRPGVLDGVRANSVTGKQETLSIGRYRGVDIAGRRRLTTIGKEIRHLPSPSLDLTTRSGNGRLPMSLLIGMAIESNRLDLVDVGEFRVVRNRFHQCPAVRDEGRMSCVVNRF